MADGIAPYRTIPEVLSDAARRDRDGIWIRSDEGSVSFGGALAQTAASARALREAGVGHGDLVMVTLRTTPSYLLCWLALASLGVVTVAANPRSSPAELAGLAHQTSPRAVITDAGLSPLFHINAPAYSVMGSLTCGAGLILLPRFSAGTFLDSARRHGATEFNAIGAMLEILMRQPARAGDADTPLRLCYTGPAPARERQEEMERRFGLRIVVGYAMSESPYGLIWPHGSRPYETLGSLRQHPRLGVVNEGRVVGDDGEDLPAGETGELLLRNPVITPGYWGMPELTAEAITGDGWLHTGDLVTVDEAGTFTFVARKKEVLRRRGENLSPAEVEEALASHPAVLECAVVGVPSELSEEDVKEFVVPTPGAQLDFAQLRAHVAGLLAAYKVPRYWQAVDDLPRTPTSRVAKHRLPAGHPPGEYDAEAVS